MSVDKDLIDNDKNFYVKAYVKYENNENPSIPTHNNNIRINALNNYYKGMTLTQEITGNITGKMNHGDINKYETKDDILTIPITDDILNKSIEQQITLKIPNSIDNTIHKSQGSEFPIVIIPLHKSQEIMLNMNLLYTAITRAKSKLIIIGDPVLFTEYLKINSIIIEHFFVVILFFI